MATDSSQPTLNIALIGDYNHEVIAHQAIPLALGMAAENAGLQVQFQWLPTDGICS